MSIGGKPKPVSDGGSAKIRDAAAKIGDEAGRAGLDTADTITSAVDDFYQTYLKDSFDKVQEAMGTAQERSDALYAQQNTAAQAATDAYTEYGKPAQEKYFKEAKEYNPEGDAQRQYALAAGDINQQYKVGQEQESRRQQALGINPASGAGAFNTADMAGKFALAKASAAARIRGLTEGTQRQYTANAANAGAQLGQTAAGLVGAQGATIGQGAGLPVAQVGALSEGFKPIAAGYSAAGGIQADMYKSSIGGQTAAAQNITSASIQDSKNAAASSAGLGSMVGLGAKLATSYFFPPAAAIPT